MGRSAHDRGPHRARGSPEHAGAGGGDQHGALPVDSHVRQEPALRRCQGARLRAGPRCGGARGGARSTRGRGQEHRGRGQEHPAAGGGQERRRVVLGASRGGVRSIPGAGPRRLQVEARSSLAAGPGPPYRSAEGIVGRALHADLVKPRPLRPSCRLRRRLRRCHHPRGSGRAQVRGFLHQVRAMRVRGPLGRENCCSGGASFARRWAEGQGGPARREAGQERGTEVGHSRPAGGGHFII